MDTYNTGEIRFNMMGKIYIEDHIFYNTLLQTEISQVH